MKLLCRVGHVTRLHHREKQFQLVNIHVTFPQPFLMFLNSLLNISGIDTQNVSGLSSAAMVTVSKPKGWRYIRVDVRFNPRFRDMSLLGNLQAGEGHLGTGPTLPNRALLERH